MTYKDKASYESSPPCNYNESQPLIAAKTSRTSEDAPNIMSPDEIRLQK